MPNIDLTNALLFSLLLLFLLYLWLTFFAPSLLFVNFCPIHNRCVVSESGWRFGPCRHEREREKQKKRDRDGEQQAEWDSELSRSNYVKQNYLTHWKTKKKKKVVNSAKVSVCAPVWHNDPDCSLFSLLFHTAQSIQDELAAAHVLVCVCNVSFPFLSRSHY